MQEAHEDTRICTTVSNSKKYNVEKKLSSLNDFYGPN